VCTFVPSRGSHDNLPYHYHTQIITASTQAGGGGAGASYLPTTSTQFYATTTGPYKCWKNDITQITNFWAAGGGTVDTGTQPCCGATNYFAQPGIVINGAGTLSTGTGTTAPTKPPTKAPTSARPTASRAKVSAKATLAGSITAATFNTQAQTAFIAAVASAANVRPLPFRLTPWEQRRCVGVSH